MDRMKREAVSWEPEDIESELSGEPQLLQCFQRLPKNLWEKHFQKLQDIKKSSKAEEPGSIAQERLMYMVGILEAREQSIVETGAADPFFRDSILAVPEREAALGRSLRDLLASQGNDLGAGQTARVKSMTLEGMEKKIAVKYLLTPTAKTLSVDGEHDMLHEVETISEIETAEKGKGVGNYIRVPHPLFFYKRGALQCYGMEEVQGVGLDKLINDGPYNSLRETVLEAVRRRYESPQEIDALHKELDEFAKGMHEVCLHGDIKFANIMVDTNGVLYLIDFGQSVSIRSISDKTSDPYENRKEEEFGQLMTCVRALINRIRAEAQPLAA